MRKISRSAIEKYIGCARCFYLQYKHRVSPPSIPFTLNSAVDNLCKNEFDYYREREEPHPLFIEHGIDAVPFKHPEMDDWRNWRKGLSYSNEELGYLFYGAVDDIWQKPNGELIVSDVKSTSKNEFNWDETYKYPYGKGYQRQLEMYQWILRKKGFEVSNTAYLVYYNGLKNEPMFNQELKFELELVTLECNDDWVEEKIIEAVNVLNRDQYPAGKKDCEMCDYLTKRWNIFENYKKEK